MMISVPCMLEENTEQSTITTSKCNMITLAKNRENTKNVSHLVEEMDKKV